MKISFRQLRRAKELMEQLGTVDAILEFSSSYIFAKMSVSGTLVLDIPDSVAKDLLLRRRREIIGHLGEIGIEVDSEDTKRLPTIDPTLIPSKEEA